MKLTPASERFILHWGEMGTRWGINRTVAQIHALLYLSPSPLNAEDIAETLSVARSNVSTSLRELQSWGLVNVVHVLGDRRDHFETLKDVWEMFRIVAAQRKIREFDPTTRVLRECLTQAKKSKSRDSDLEDRLANMLDFFDAAGRTYQQCESIPTSTWRKLMRAKKSILKLLAKP